MDGNSRHPLQIIAGDEHGLNTLEYQPAKIAAMEGHYETRKGGAPLILFGIPNNKTGKTDYSLEIPYLGSLILTRSLTGEIKGLKEFPRDQWPPTLTVFWSFRIMVGIGFAMLGIGMWSLWARYRSSLYESPLLFKAALAMGPAGFVAVLAGWITTEVGRQPYTVYGLLTTADSISPIAAPAVAGSLIAFIVVYFFVFGAGVYYLFHMMARSPDHASPTMSKGPIRSAGITPVNQLNTTPRTSDD